MDAMRRFPRFGQSKPSALQNSGAVQGEIYFQCKPSHMEGAFVEESALPTQKNPADGLTL